MTNSSSFFKLTINNQPASVERLLRVIRHRGFSLLYFNVEAEKESLKIEFKVESSRSVHLLFNQLEKLYDVKQISLDTP